MGIEVTHKGSFNNLEKFLKGYNRNKLITLLEKFGRDGVYALANSTPIDSGETASSWDYEIVITESTYGVRWVNYHMAGNTPLVLLLQYGHGTKSGGFVQGNDFINPTMRPVFDNIAQTLWEEVTKL